MNSPDQLVSRALPARVELGNFARERAAGEVWLAEAAAAGRTALTLDLTPVTAASSLLVALLVAWLRRARMLGLQLEIIAVPVAVQAIIEFSGLEGLLPAAGAAGQAAGRTVMSDPLEVEIAGKLAERFPGAQIEVVLDGNRALVAIAHGEFADLSRVKRQQAVYGVIGSYVTDGTLHAVTIQASVPDPRG